MALQNIIKIVFNLVVGVCLFLILIEGINVFYPSPTPPNASSYVAPCPIVQPTQKSVPINCTNETVDSKYLSDIQKHSHNVAIYGILFTVIISIVGMYFLFRHSFLSFGALTCAFLSFVYAYSNSNSSSPNNSVLSFLIAITGFLLLIPIGYLIFGRGNYTK